jgi:lysophospholipase L1-like esterase
LCLTDFSVRYLTNISNHKTMKNSLLFSSIFMLLQLLLLPQLGANALADECPDTMVSYWHLGDSVEPYQDYLSLHPGTCSTLCPTPVSGIIGDAQLFDGTETGINVEAASSFDWNAADSFTIEFWVQRNAADFTDFEVIIGRDDGMVSPLQWWVGINSAGTAEFSLVDQSGSGPIETVVGNTQLLDGNWHHVVVVRDGLNNQNLLYVDGALDSAAQNFVYTAGFQSATAPINIGWLRGGSGGFHYGGNLDELAIYDEALSDFEIWQHSFDGLQGFGLGYCYDGTPIRVMPLGDSITRGTSTTITDEDYIVGYRQKLFRTLQSYGYSVDFVGGNEVGSLALLPFDPDNEGHPGWTASQVANNVYSWLTLNPADIVLLHIGTNNVEITTTSQVEYLLNEIDRYSEDTIVLLARIINRKTISAATTTFNDNVEAMAMARIANGDKILMVDMEGALLYPYDITDDNIHPTATGYEKMAATWFAALEGFLPTANALPVLNFSSEIKRFKTTQGLFPLEQSVTLDTFDGAPASDLTFTSDVSWLDVAVADDTTPTTVTFSVNDDTIPVGLYSAYVTASSPGYVDAVIEINLVVVTANSDYELLVSSMPDGSNPLFLQNTNLTGDVYIFTSPDLGVSNVSFYLDQDLHRVENFGPFDFEGGDPFNTIQLANGEHEITAIIKTSTGQTEVISSFFNVNSLLPSLIFNTNSLVFDSTTGNLPVSKELTLGSSDSTAADFSVFVNVDWLTLTPVTGTTTATVTASVNDSTLEPGIYTATITAVADGYINTTVAVSYNVLNPGGSAYNLLLSASSDRSSSVALDGASVSGDIYVFTGPDNDVSSVTFSLDGSLVKTEGLAPFDLLGSTTANKAIPYDTTQLTDGQHEISALINLTGGGSELISGTFEVNNNIPALTVDAGNISFQSLQGSLPGDQIINLATSDNSIGVAYTISSDVDWLMVTPTIGTTPAAITVSVTDSTLVPGVYNAIITVVANGYADATIAVSYSVTTPGGSVYSLLFSTFPDRSGPATIDGAFVSGNFYVFTGPDDGVSSVTFSLDGAIVKTEGLAPFDLLGSTITDVPIPYDTTQLTDGQHEISALINLTGGGSELISGTFEVNNNIPALTVDASNIFFQSLQGSFPEDQIINLATSDNSAEVEYTISSDVNWLMVSPALGTTPASLTISVIDSTLSPGVHTATITADANGYTETIIEVSYSVTTPGGSVYSLLFSTSSDRSGPAALDEAFVSGEIYVFTGPDDGVSKVTFSLDGAIVKTEGLAPFDLLGSTVADVPIPYDTTQLADGQHEISALITLTDGGSELISGTFEVNNNIPGLTVDATNIFLQSLQGSFPEDQIVNLATSDDSTGAEYTIFSDVDWLTVSPAIGATPVALTISVNDSTLTPGVYSATITAVANDYTDATIAVSYSVTTPGGNAYNLLFSTSPNRSSPDILEEATVSGDIYVFTGPDDGVSSVTFYLDGIAVKTEGLAPFDFAGTAAIGAIPYDTLQLTDGQHEIRALINLSDGSVELISSIFTVSN